MIGVALATIVIALPALAFVIWPFLAGRSRGRRFLALPPNAREQLLEQKHGVLRALNELDFEHQAGHVSDEDYAELRVRYEADAASVLTELDKLEAAREAAAPPSRPHPGEQDEEEAPAPSGWRHPAAIGVTAVALLAFGVALGVGISRYSAPEAPASVPPAGATMGGPAAGMMSEGAGGPGGVVPGGNRPITPEIKTAMLKAARESLMAGNYQDAIAAYQAILRHDPKNVDAITHLGLIVAIGGHADAGLEAFDRALTLEPNYPPALLYRGQVLYEAKRNAPEAIRTWEKFLKVVPAGEDRDRVQKMIAQAKAGPPPAPQPDPASSQSGPLR